MNETLSQSNTKPVQNGHIILMPAIKYGIPNLSNKATTKNRQQHQIIMKIYKQWQWLGKFVLSVHLPSIEKIMRRYNDDSLYCNGCEINTLKYGHSAS